MGRGYHEAGPDRRLFLTGIVETSSQGLSRGVIMSLGDHLRWILAEIPQTCAGREQMNSWIARRRTQEEEESWFSEQEKEIVAAQDET